MDFYIYQEPSEGWTVEEIEPVKPSESRRLTFKYGYKSTDTLPLKLHTWGGISRRGATELLELHMDFYICWTCASIHYIQDKSEKLSISET